MHALERQQEGRAVLLTKANHQHAGNIAAGPDIATEHANAAQDERACSGTARAMSLSYARGGVVAQYGIHEAM